MILLIPLSAILFLKKRRGIKTVPREAKTLVKLLISEAVYLVFVMSSADVAVRVFRDLENDDLS